MKKGRLVLAILFILSSTLVNAQSKKYKIEGKKCTRVEITDPGELYSSYELLDEDLAILKIENVKPFLLESIQNNHTEDKWPSELGNLESRVDNPDKMKSLVAYKVCKLDGKYLLVIPAKHNSELGSGWAPSRDIFMVIGESGIKE